MKTFIELVDFGAVADGPSMREKIRLLEDLGATGVNIWDHIFIRDESPTGDPLRIFCDPLTTLAAVAAVSDRLEVQTTVMNSAWMNAGLQLRQWCQLAVLAGGDRVTAGLGAGWNTEEYRAIGAHMQNYDERMTHLEEIFIVARQLFEEGVATYEGKHVRVDNLPLAPRPSVTPRLLSGGGSERILRIAGTYCDVHDLHGNPKYASFRGKDMAEKHRKTNLAIASTTNTDTAVQRDVIRAASVAAGRPADAVEIAMQMQFVVFTNSKAEKRAAEEKICLEWAGFDEWRSLDEVPCMLVGDAREMADLLNERREIFGLNRIEIKEMSKYSLSGDYVDIDQERFLKEVVPLLD